MSQMKTKDKAELYAQYAWPRWEAYIRSRHPGGDLSLPQLLGLVPAYSPGRAERQKTQRPIVFSHDIPRYCVRQLERLAEAGKIPGAFRAKGGRWRVTISEQLCRWLAAGGLSPKPNVAELKLMERDWQIKHVIALETRSGLDGGIAKNADPRWKTSLARFAQAESLANVAADRCRELLARREDLTDEERENLEDEIERADFIKRVATLVKSPAGLPRNKSRQLRVAAAISEMRASDEKFTWSSLAERVGVSRYTLARIMPPDLRGLVRGEREEQASEIAELKESVRALKRTKHRDDDTGETDSFAETGLTD